MATEADRAEQDWWYRNIDCVNCHRRRVLPNHICEICWWDNQGGNYASITIGDFCLDSATGHHISSGEKGFGGFICKHCRQDMNENYEQAG